MNAHTPSLRVRLLPLGLWLVLGLLPTGARADLTSERPVDTVQLGASAIASELWNAAPGVRADVGWLRGFSVRHAFVLRLEGGASVVERSGKPLRSYPVTAAFGFREWLGPRHNGFVEFGARLGVAYLAYSDGRDSEIFLASELLFITGGVSLGPDHDIDLAVTAGWGYPGGGGVLLRVPLWHSN